MILIYINTTFKLKKKIAKIQLKNKQYKKFNNIIKDNHIKKSNYIVSNYDVILLLKFESQKLKLKNKHYNSKFAYIICAKSIYNLVLYLFYNN